MTRQLVKLDVGKKLTEAMVKGSISYFINQVRRAFTDQFDLMMEDDWSIYVEEVWADYVVVSNSAKLQPGQYWQVNYTADGDSFTFDTPDDWTLVELTYTPVSVSESLAREARESDKSSKFSETTLGSLEFVDESRAQDNSAGPWPIKAVGITSNVVNENRRIYRPHVLAAAVDVLRSHLHESAGQGRAFQLYGEAEHPSMKANRRPFLDQVVVNWTGVSFDGSQVLLEGKLLGTIAGKDIRAQMLGGVMPGVSQRAYGTARLVEVDGQEVEEVNDLVITGYDLTVEPSDPEAGVTYFESADRPTIQQEANVADKNKTEGSEPTVNGGLMSYEELAATNPDLVKDIEARYQAKQEATRREQREAEEQELAERQQIVAEANTQLRQELGLSETDDLMTAVAERNERLAALEAAETDRQVQAFVQSEVKAISGYPSWAREKLEAAVLDKKPASKDEAKALIASQRQFIDGLLSEARRAAMGDPNALHVLGPVIEQATGQPAYLAPVLALTESVVANGLGTNFLDEANRPHARNSRFADAYLKKFDDQYRHRLVAEASQFSEAEQTSDLNLPYSVMRAVVAQALPALVATSVFDVQTTDQPDVRIYYEAYSGETGEEVSVTDEAVTSDEDAWVQMDHNRIIPGTVVVEPDGGGTAYVEGTDYVVDYANGKIWTITAANGGSIGDSTALDVDYDYKAVRLGEMAAIEAGKATLSYVTVSVAADRLATQISRESVVFSRASLGWDATARTIAMLVNQVRRYIDQGLLEMAVASSLKVPSNGLSWDDDTEDVAALVEKLGQAKVKILNRYYEPTAYLMSVTNAEIVSNWDGFSAAGARPDALLGANGFVGRIKGLPLFQSTEMRDTYDLALNRELVAHRVFQAMQLQGPFPSYSSGELLAAEMYYLEEFNATATPVDGKGAWVKHT